MRTDLAERQPTPVSGSSAEQRRLPIVAHLDELRRRLWVCVLAISVASVASFGWAAWLIDWLKRPAGVSLPRLAFFSPPEAMLAYLKVAVTSGLIFCTPLLLFEVWAFVSPGLTPRERRYGLAFVWWGTGLFVAGIAFAYWVLLPVSLRFLLGFGGGQLAPVISVSRYLSFTTMVMIACGVIFELPLAVALLTKLGLVSPQTLRRRWRHAVLVMAIAAAILTPTTDVATMLLMVAPMLVLYELAIWVATVIVGRRRREVVSSMPFSGDDTDCKRRLR
jgi:sec-independent protein translocase protein TatC